MIDSDPTIRTFQSDFDAAAASFERAFAQAGQRVDLTVGDQRWRIDAAGRDATDYLRAFAHLHDSIPDGDPALTVCLWDYGSTDEAPPAPAWAWQRELPHSRESRFEDGRFLAAQYYNGFYLLLDYPSRRALVWHECRADLPSWEYAAPLRELVELWFKAGDLIRLHAGAVGLPAGGVLLAGKSGSGKSTTSLACLRAGLGYAGDDYVLVDSARLTLYSLYCSGKLLPDSLLRLPELMPAIPPLANTAAEKAIFYLDGAFPAQVLTRFPLKAIFVPHLTHEAESRLDPISPVRAIQALAPSTLLQAADPTPHDFAKIAQIAKALPCYQLNAGTDLAQLAGLVKDFLSDA